MTSLPSAIRDAPPAFWSALASWGSLATALTVMAIQRRAYFEAARPEIVLDGWERTSDAVVRFTKIRNVGKGIAFNVFLGGRGEADGKPTFALPTLNLPVLAAGETIEVDAKIHCFWKWVPGPTQMLPITISAQAWDARQLTHVTTYSLVLVPQPSLRQTGEVAPGVLFPQRRVESSSVLRLRLERLPGRIGRLFRARIPRVEILTEEDVRRDEVTANGD